ncbi:thiamine-phosphate kinase [Ramlibacter algicola]|uniref:Thiamine-monophosphate kinase n=1 Tax=Ramlibacter algicola TaxID=2795217 RepID=A0A934PW43_9BURK|nr:thiamine-phosphate kinase [Ramlibacter algicola]MBK0391564.1 thiamine-phosphate kinase [Ramlibacter algicola]
MGEFELIDRYFRRTAASPQVALGVGDDCALLQPTPGRQLAVSTDLLLEGRHFFPGADPRALGHKALAVNLSDLAACGARPLAFTLALALPAVDETWLAGLSQGLLALADASGCALVGGDTTRGPLAIGITVFGEVEPGKALLRSGARAGDDLYVSGSLGDARLALEALQGRIELPPGLLASARQRLDTPQPRLALGQALAGVATAAIDVSDGLLGDLGHVLKQSNVGATVDTLAALPLLDNLQAARAAGVDESLLLQCVLAGGDDYELAFTALPSHRDAVATAAKATNTRVTRIGSIDSQPGVRLLGAGGQPVHGRFASFDHFA